MVVSQASIFVPCWNWAMLAQARSNVSCTRSSARSGLRQSEIANARRRGMAASMAARSEGSSSMIAVPYRGALCRRPGTKSQASLHRSIARMRRSRYFRIAAIRRPLRQSGVGSLDELEPSIARAHAARYLALGATAAGMTGALGLQCSGAAMTSVTTSHVRIGPQGTSAENS